MGRRATLIAGAARDHSVDRQLPNSPAPARQSPPRASAWLGYSTRVTATRRVFGPRSASRSSRRGTRSGIRQNGRSPAPPAPAGDVADFVEDREDHLITGRELRSGAEPELKPPVVDGGKTLPRPRHDQASRAARWLARPPPLLGTRIGPPVWTLEWRDSAGLLAQGAYLALSARPAIVEAAKASRAKGRRSWFAWLLWGGAQGQKARPPPAPPGSAWPGRGGLTVPQQRHSIGPVFGEGKVVGDGQRLPALRQPGAQPPAPRCARDQRGCRFIERQHRRRRARARNSDPLLLPPEGRRALCAKARPTWARASRAAPPLPPRPNALRAGPR